jgi:hypothetical protein
MFRAAVVLLVALAGVASAQDRSYLDVELQLGEDRPRHDPQHGTLSIASTGTVAVALERSILITDRLGRTKGRAAFPAAERALGLVCVVAIDDRDIAVLYRYAGKAAKRGLVLFRHGTDGRLKRERQIAEADLDVAQCTATRDHALLLLGSAGGHAWWLSKVSIDGGRVFEARSTGRPPERIAAMAARPAGHWFALIQRLDVEGAKPDWYLHHYVDGKPKEQLRLGISRGGYAAAMFGDGGVIAATDDTLYFIDDLGSITREASWPFHSTGTIIPGDDGFWAIVGLGDEIPSRLVRVNDKGDIRFRHPPMRIAGIARAPENQIAVVAVSEDGREARLLRFDHRSGVEHLP